MKRSFQTALLSLISIACFAQDTTWVQTLTFDSITTRRGLFEFPDGSESYRKVLMYHKLKCSPQTTADNFNCGEWDYLTYNYLYEHTGLLDSTALDHAYFLVGSDAPDSVTVTSALAYDAYAVERTLRVIDNTTSETFHVISAMDAVDLGTFDNSKGAVRSQFVYTGTELNTAGLQPGAVQQLRLNVNFAGDPLGRVTIKMKNTNSALFEGIDLVGLETVYDHSYAFASGTNIFVLENPFTWDGSSNILVDLSFSEPQGNTGTRLFAQQGSLQLAGRTDMSDRYLNLERDHLALDPTPLGSLSDEVTVMCWVYGNEDLLPANTYLFEALDADGKRIMNVHLPWSNGSMYWDAGNDGSGYDRINSTASNSEIEGQWNHWAFTKNTNTGSMKIFLNGSLWTSGTGKTKPLSGITSFVVGASANRTSGYPGKLDEFAVFSKELDAAAVEEAMGDVIGSSHPNHADLLYYYDFNEAVDASIANDQSTFATDAYLMGRIGRRAYAGADLFRNAAAFTDRPDITFVQGTYVSHTEDSTHYVNYARDIVSKVDFLIVGNEAIAIDTTWGIAGGYSYIYDLNGVASDSTVIGGITSNNGIHNYWGVPFPEIIPHELGRYITPYGINLSLGAGFTWVYDVSEFAHLLKDSVELKAGNQQELIDLRFAMIEGTAPREVVKINYPWGKTRSYSYGNMDDDTDLSAITIQTDPNASQWIMRSRLTGHGHQSNTGNYPHCCEWKNNTHYLFANGQQIDDWHIWKTNQCALNPVFPQGGTWLGAREGWCPGDLVDVRETNFTSYVSGGQIEVDYDITDVPSNNQGMASGNYVASFELVEFAAASHSLDAEVYLVKRPTDYEYYRRNNPICTDPIIVIRNAGSQTLTSVTVTYGVSGGTTESYTWTGSLEHMEMEEISLPVSAEGFWFGDSDRQFTATLSAPNGSTDEYAHNDSYNTTFELPEVYAHQFIVVLKTNNRPSENSWTIKDIQGNVVASNGTLSANAIHYDTLNLPAACYTFELLDTGNDGLSYWADPAAGSGYCRFKKIGSSYFELFPAEFGRSIEHSFALWWVLGVDEVSDEALGFELFPNPSAGNVNLHLTHLAGDAVVEVRSITGELLLSEQLELSGDDQYELSLKDEPAGLYLVQVLNAGRIFTKKLVLER